jgi:hypothetical protein
MPSAAAGVVVIFRLWCDFGLNAFFHPSRTTLFALHHCAAGRCASADCRLRRHANRPCESNKAKAGRVLWHPPPGACQPRPHRQSVPPRRCS